MMATFRTWRLQPRDHSGGGAKGNLLRAHRAHRSAWIIEHRRYCPARGERNGVEADGVGHRDWTGLTATELRYELVASKTALQEIWVYPAPLRYRSDATMLRCCGHCGRRGTRSPTQMTGASTNATAFLRCRTSVRSDATQAELHQILSGYMPPLRRLRRTAAIAVKNQSKLRRV